MSDFIHRDQGPLHDSTTPAVDRIAASGYKQGKDDLLRYLILVAQKTEGAELWRALFAEMLHNQQPGEMNRFYIEEGALHWIVMDRSLMRWVDRIHKSEPDAELKATTLRDRLNAAEVERS